MPVEAGGSAVIVEIGSFAIASLKGWVAVIVPGCTAAAVSVLATGTVTRTGSLG